MRADGGEGGGEIGGLGVGGECFDDGVWARGGAEGGGEGGKVVRVSGEEGDSEVAVGGVREDAGYAGALSVWWLVWGPKKGGGKRVWVLWLGRRRGGLRDLRVPFPTFLKLGDALYALDIAQVLILIPDVTHRRLSGD